MLWEFLRHDKQEKLAAKPDSRFQFQRRVPVLSLELAHGLFGFEPTFDRLAKGRHGSGGFFGEFFAVVTEYQRKIRQKIHHPKKTKESAETQPPPPQNHQTDQKSAAKSTNTSSRQTSKRTPGFCD